jgi:hypothetical protein
MPLRIEERLWEQASELQRAEWRTLISDLLDEGFVLFGQGQEPPMVVFNGSCLRVQDAQSAPTELALWSEDLERHAAEYLRVIRLLMDEDMPPSRFEALDMGKKVVHDQAAKALAALAPHVCESHASYRRLFSLLISLRIDTTKLPTAHGHRAQR